MKFLLCLITGLISLCFGIRGFGQSNARTTQEEADDMFSNLDLSYATSGIIYSRVFPAAALNAFPNTEVSNAGHWQEAQSEFYRGAMNSYGMLPPEYLEGLIFESYNIDNKIPLGVILGHFNEVNSDAVETDAQGKLRLRAGFNSSQVFTSKQIDAVSFMLTSIPLGTNNFHLPKWAVCSNQGVGVVSVSINFGDGNPVRVLSPGSSAVQATYTTPGTKQVTYTVNCTDGSQRTAKSSFEVSPNARVVNNYPYRGPGGDNIDSVRIEADIAFQGYSETAASKGKGDALIYYAFGRDQIRKPVIILDGFDPQGTRGAKDLYEEYLSYSDNGMKIFGTDLRENTPGNGYDVLILNPPKYQYGSPKTVRVCRRVGQGQQDCEDIQVMNIRSGGGDYIERNAMVLVKLIQMLKQQLQANGSSEKIVVMGPSMGGLISRYALRYMEMNGMDHNCKLWVSFDSPHHGANISMGLQDFLFHTGYEMEMAGPKKIVDETLDSPAAKQMLIHHFRGRSNDLPHGAPGYRDRFVQAINQMGFPQSSCLRKVAINNGSKNATSQNFSGGAEALSLSMKLTNLGHITCAVMGGLLCIVARDRIAEFKIYASPNGNDHSLTMRKRFTSFNWGGVDRFVYGVGQPSLDNLPGSYRPYFQQVADDAVAKKWVYQTTVNVHFARPTFIPAFSSWVLSNYQNRNWG